VFAAALAAPAAGQQRPERIRGYVVEVVSPNRFTLDDYRIDRDRQYRIHLDLPSGVVDQAIAVGSELELDATPEEGEAAFRASAFRKLRAPLDHTPSTTTIAAPMPFEKGERSMINSMRIKVKEPVYAKRRSGSVLMGQRTSFQIIPREEIQRYINDLGWRLVPEFQRNLPDADPAKIPFKFYVIKTADVGASALPNGVVMVYQGLFEMLENESQLAAIMAHEISHVIQKHMWKLSYMPESVIKTDYRRAFENQSDRQSLSFMLAAGYDPREAAKTWRLMAKKLGFSPLRGSHENYYTRRAFMMNELETEYRNLDYGMLITEEARYREMAALVKKPW
jgi:hypothetical protein